MSSIFKKLKHLRKKDEDHSLLSSPAPSKEHPSTPGEPTLNLNLIAMPFANRPIDSPGEKKKVYLAAGLTILNHLKEISAASDFLAPLQIVCGVTTVILETIEGMDSNEEAWKSTLQTIQKHRRTFEQQLKNMNARNVLPDADPGLLDPIKAYGEDLGSILGALMLENGITAATVPRESMFQGLATFMKRYGTVKVEADTISGYNDQLEEAMNLFQGSMTIYMGFKLQSMGQDLQKLVQISSTANQELLIANEIKLKPRPRLVPNFVGREDVLEAMRQAHFNTDQAKQQAPVITILSGIGGLGKTQTALKLALEFEKTYPDVLILFLDASAIEKLQADLENAIRSRGTAYHSKSYEDALAWLATECKNWLVILDNADDPNVDFTPYIPQCTHGHIIITTRNATLAVLAPDTSHALEGLSVSNSITLLLTASKYPPEKENESSAKEITLELGYLPLALAHAAGYIFVHRCLKTYLAMYQKNRQQILASTNSKLLQDYRSSVTMTIAMSLEKLTERARDILHLFSHLSVASIPLSIIAKAAERRFQYVEWTDESSLTPGTLSQAEALMKIFCPSGEWSEFDFNDPITECLQYSLLQLTTEGDDKFYSMHVLVQSHLQAADLIHNHKPRQLVGRLLGSAVTIGASYEFLAFNRLLLPHIRLVQIEDVTEAGDHFGLGCVLDELGDTRLALVHEEKCVEIWKECPGKEDERTIEATNRLANTYTDAGRNQAALELTQEVLSVRKRVLGPEHPETLRTMGNLAISYMKLGKNQAAMELQEEVLSLRRRLLGPEHPDTVRTMGDLAVSYSDMGKYQAALELDEEVLPLQKKLHGPEHPDTLRSMSNLAISYKMANKYQAALELEEEVLSLQTRLLGPEHPETVRTMCNISKSYANLGQNQRALEVVEEALSIQKKRLGLEHPDTVQAMNNLALVYSMMGKDQAALDLDEEILSLRKRLLGPEHPMTVQAMNSLVVAYATLGKNQEALELEEEVVSLRKRLLGDENPDTILAMNNLGILYRKLGKNQAALELEEEVLSIRRRILGPEHPDTMDTMVHLAISYQDLGKNQAALELEEEVLSLQKKLLGPEHPDVVETMANLADTYSDLGKDQEALEMREEVLSLRKKLLGPEDPETVRAMSNVASSYMSLSRNQEAMELQEEVLALRKRLLGPEHPKTLLTMGNLAVSYQNLDKNQAALELEEEVLSLQKRLLGPEHPDTLLAMGNLAISHKKLGNNQAALELEEQALSLQTRILGEHHRDTLNTMVNLSNTYENLNMHDQRLELLQKLLPALEASESYGPDHPMTVAVRNELNELSARLAKGSD